MSSSGSSPLWVHVPSLVEGESLCGHRRNREIRVCELCAARLRVLREVHIQSRRDPGRTFCGRSLDPGLLLGGGDVDRLIGSDVPPSRPPLMFVRSSEARIVIEGGGGGGGVGMGVETCENCRDNFLRSEDYLRRSRFR
jgi:hypothetical protein